MKFIGQVSNVEIQAGIAFAVLSPNSTGRQDGN
jgi:hypothetical protein